jgi:hypothetical protein
MLSNSNVSLEVDSTKLVDISEGISSFVLLLRKSIDLSTDAIYLSFISKLPSLSIVDNGETLSIKIQDYILWI